MSTDKRTNSAGACYFVSSVFGWSIAPTPWEALAKVDLVYSGRPPSMNSSRFVEATRSVNLYYIPDESAFHHVDHYAPCAGDGSPVGVLLYAAVHEHNDQLIHDHLHAVTPSK